MKVRNLFRSVQPFISAMAVIATAAALVFTIYFTELGMQWTTFLAGILVAATLAEASRVSHVEWVAKRRTAQLSAVKDRLDRETQLRKRAEEVVAASTPRLHLIDEVLPTMVVFIDIEGHCQYHNRAFMDWLHMRPEQIHGRHLREILGAKIYEETASQVRQSMDGHPAHYDRMQKMSDGTVYRLSVEHIPQFCADGKVTGFHMLMNDITSPGDVHMSDKSESQGSAHVGSNIEKHVSVHDGSASQTMFIDSFVEQITGQEYADQIMAAIENGSFRLFSQMITPLSVDSGEAEHHEILVRLIDEEESMLPPGDFFPLAEKYGLMPHLDRWVVQHVTEWASRQHSQDEKWTDSIFFLNVSGATIGDPGFPEFLQLTLLEHGVPGTALCFEISDSDLSLSAPVVAEFARQVRQCGCSVAISGFGRDRVLFELIQDFQVQFLKIDGSIIFDILRDPVALAKLTAINKVAKNIDIKTVAELVENKETIAKLSEIGIDFAQGFGISRPQPLG